MASRRGKLFSTLTSVIVGSVAAGLVLGASAVAFAGEGHGHEAQGDKSCSGEKEGTEAKQCSGEKKDDKACSGEKKDDKACGGEKGCGGEK